MFYLEEFLDNIVSIITALIACWALLRTSKIEYSQKGQRAHWFFDEYLLSLGKCIVSYEDNKEEYYANYIRYLLYADEEIAEQMKTIDLLLDKDNINENEKIKQVEKMKDMYKRKYDTKQYELKKNNRI